MVKPCRALALALLSNFCLFASAFAATLTVTAREVGDAVVFVAEGAVDLEGLTPLFADDVALPAIFPAFGIVDFGRFTGTNDIQFYSLEGVGIVPVFGTGFAAAPDSVTGDLVFIERGVALDVVGVPLGYVSLAPLMATMTFNASTFVSLGIATGIYEFSFGRNTWVFDFGGAPIPLPPAVTLFIAGICGIGLLAQRRSPSHRRR